MSLQKYLAKAQTYQDSRWAAIALTTPESIEQGIGPDCATKGGQ